ncbi:MAG: phosphate acetyltransferase [Sedimentisphaerales bacterium]|nr:phosphate acetyltransferase [Sedimentisphaerales bacterium]
MDIIKKCEEKVRGKKFRLVLPEGEDERIVQAARQLKERTIADPIVLGKPEKIAEAEQKAGMALDGIEKLNPRESQCLEKYAEEYAKGRDDINPAIARRLLMKPVFFAGMMVAAGNADAVVCGAATATATVIQSGVLTIGLGEGIHTPSSYFLMVIPSFLGDKDKLFIYADCAVNIDPSVDDLADIAIASAQSAVSLLDDEPRVAMLSFSTKGSASSPSVEKVIAALEIVRRRKPSLLIDGEFQADSAIVPRVAAKKVKGESSVAGRANVLIFPDLDAGNIAYKLTQYMAGAQAIGPFLQGFAKPISDLSRGAGVEDIISTAIITLAKLVE